MSQTHANTIVTIGTIVLAFAILTSGGYFLAKFASTVVLSQADQAARDVSGLFIMASGTKGDVTFKYEIPKGSTLSGSSTLTFSFTPEQLSVTDDGGFTRSLNIPYTGFPADWETNGIPRVVEKATKINIIVSDGRVVNVIKVE